MQLELINKAISYRAHIHANPELSFEEFATSDYVKQQLDTLGVAYVVMAGTGVVAVLQGINPNKHCIAFRSELDALPITELNNVPYKSKNQGIMHACGHDVHTACLLAIAEYLKLDNTWEGTVKLIFQPGEEKDPGGASLLIKEGILEQEPKINAIFALHVYPHLTVGTVGTRGGVYMASADEVYITIKGKGGHAATPHLCIDPIMISAQVLTQLQTIVSRNRNPIHPTVLTFGKIVGGTKGNIIPDEVLMEGTLRCMNEEWRMQCFDLIKNQTQAIAKSMGGDAIVEILKGYPCVHNNEALTVKVNNLLDKNSLINRVDLPIRMTADDFSFYTHKIPGCYIRIGTASKDNKQFTSSVHTATFDIDTDAIPAAMQVIKSIVQNFQL